MSLPTPTMADGLVEASRGLWRSAIESFSAAAEAAPDDPAPLLALACCHLARDTPELALVVLETRPTLVRAGPPWCLRRDWLVAAARLALGDALGAEAAARRLPAPLADRALGAVRLAAGDYLRGLDLLLAGHRPRATVSASRRMP
ncbi:MAG: hypothetical protein R3F60_08880 [bacterium]